MNILGVPTFLSLFHISTNMISLSLKYDEECISEIIADIIGQLYPAFQILHRKIGSFLSYAFMFILHSSIREDYNGRPV